MLQFKWACVKILRKRKTVACLLVDVLWPGFCFRIRPLAGLTTFWWIEIFVADIDSLQTDSCSPCVIFFKLIPRLYFTCGSTSKLLHRSPMFENWRQMKSGSKVSRTCHRLARILSRKNSFLSRVKEQNNNLGLTTCPFHFQFLFIFPVAST